MKVKMRTIMSGPRGTYLPGDTVTVDAAVGSEMVRTGFAEAVAVEDPKPARRRVKEAPGQLELETAAMELEERR